MGYSPYKYVCRFIIIICKNPHLHMNEYIIQKYTIQVNYLHIRTVVQACEHVPVNTEAQSPSSS